MSKIFIFILSILVLGGAYFLFSNTNVIQNPNKQSQLVALSNCGITVNAPLENEIVSSPIVINTIVDNTNMQTLGCNWVTFEAQAGVVELKDVGGAVLGQSLLTTTDDWMQIGPVNYTSILTPTATLTPGETYSLVFTEENPSGEGVEDTLIVPVVAQ